MPTPVAAACRNHPDREAIGLCIECRAQVCSECVTKVDGINYCVACLATLADRGSRRERGDREPAPPWRGRFAALVWLGTVALLSWGLLEVTLPGGR